MSDYHVLEGDAKGKRFTVAMHITVPTTVNEANITITTALTEDPNYTAASIVPHISATETAALSNGTLYEHAISFKTDPGHSTIADRNRLDTLYSSTAIIVARGLEKKYAFWHFDRDIP